MSVCVCCVHARICVSELACVDVCHPFTCVCVCVCARERERARASIRACVCLSSVSLPMYKEN